MNDLKKINGGGYASPNYYEEINIIRGIALLLVLLGHSFPDGDTGPAILSAAWMRRFLYTFHMGVFFAISGFVMSFRLYKGSYALKLEIGKKARRLLIPYFFYSFLTIGPKILLSKYVNNPVEPDSIWMIFLGQSPNGGMWFLWHLFFVSAFCLIVMWISRNRTTQEKTIIMVAIGITGYFLYLINMFEIINYSLEFSFFFAVGVLLNRYYNVALPKFSMGLGLGVLVINMIVSCPLLSLRINKLYAFTGILGIYAIFSIAIKVVRESNRIRKILDDLGSNSYAIYLLSYFGQIPMRILFYSKLQAPYWICVASMFVGGILLPMVEIRLIRKNKLFRAIALGE